MRNKPPVQRSCFYTTNEAKRNQQSAGRQFGNGKVASVKNDKSDFKPIDVRREVAKQFDVSQGYVYAAQKIKEKDERRTLSKDKSRYHMQFTPDTLGLHRMIATSLNSRNPNKWKVPHTKAAAWLGVSVERLNELQAELNADGLISCHIGQTQGTYRIVTQEQH